MASASIFRPFTLPYVQGTAKISFCLLLRNLANFHDYYVAIFARTGHNIIKRSVKNVSVANGKAEYNVFHMEILHFMGCEYFTIMVYIFKMPVYFEIPSNEELLCENFERATQITLEYLEPNINQYDINTSLEERITLKEMICWRYESAVR